MARKTAPESEQATTAVNIADFQRTRDSVIVALATLQSSVQDLSRAYINHANTVLNPGRTGGLDVGLSNILADSGLLGTGMTGHMPAAAAAPFEAPLEEGAGVGGGKKKRKRAPHDPNAPKRALTPYFLYMQSARSQIAQELGSHAKPKEVADEGTRRWSHMAKEDKAVWDQLYQENLAIYRVKTAAYKAGQPVPDDAEAKRLVEEGKVPTAEEVDDLPAAALEEDGDEEGDHDDDDNEEDDSPEPPKATQAAGKRRKVEKAATTPAKEEPKPAPAKSSEKKTKKAKKEEQAPVPAPAPTAKPASEKKKKSKKSA